MKINHSSYLFCLKLYKSMRSQEGPFTTSHGVKDSPACVRARVCVCMCVGMIQYIIYFFSFLFIVFIK